MKWSSWMGVCWDPQKWSRNIWLTFEIEWFLFLLTWNRGVGERRGTNEAITGKKKESNYLQIDQFPPPSLTTFSSSPTTHQEKVWKSVFIFPFPRIQVGKFPPQWERYRGREYLYRVKDRVWQCHIFSTEQNYILPPRKARGRGRRSVHSTASAGASQQVVEQVADSILLVGHFPTSQYFVTTSDTASILELNLE